MTNLVERVAKSASARGEWLPVFALMSRVKRQPKAAALWGEVTPYLPGLMRLPHVREAAE